MIEIEALCLSRQGQALEGPQWLGCNQQSLVEDWFGARKVKIRTKIERKKQIYHC